MWLLFVFELFVLFTTVAGECHCYNASTCTTSPATTCRQHGGCIRGWFGPTCQKQNVALKRPAIQTSVLYERTLNLKADYAVDGIVSTHLRDSPCAHSDGGDTTPSWTVFLNTSGHDKIHHMKLYLRTTWPNRNDGMVILVDDQICYDWSSTGRPDNVTEVTCRQPLSGTSVTIRTPQEFLTLCEVQIFVCSDGWFGDDCDKQCHCLNKMDVCDKITGYCPSGCISGFSGANCQTPRAINNDQRASSPITLAVAISCGVVILIIVLVASLWIRRLQMKIKALETTREEPYASLDQTTMEQISETFYTKMA